MASMAVMLPLDRLAWAVALYLVLLAWSRLLGVAARQVWRLKWVLLVLFLIDYWVVSLDLALSVTLRLSLLACAFVLFFATTTPGELRQALARIGVPYRYAFSLSLAFQSLGILDEEWRAIREAQQVRGAWRAPRTLGDLRSGIRDLIALSVPAVVMTVKRAWAMTEAAYARGFGSPHRRPYRRLSMGALDWCLLAGALIVGVTFVLWR
jgi:energy-coupling factor transport system permease protein